MPKRGTTKFLSKKQEKKVAKDLKGREVIASGAIWSAKADVRSDAFLCECKTSEKEYYRLTPITWAKIRDEAVKDGIRLPIMCIEVKDTQLGVIRLAVFNNNELELFGKETISKVVLTTRALRVDKNMLKGATEYKYSVGVYPPVFVTVCSWDLFLEKAEEKELI